MARDGAFPGSGHFCFLSNPEPPERKETICPRRRWRVGWGAQLKNEDGENVQALIVCGYKTNRHMIDVCFENKTPMGSSQQKMKRSS